MRTASNHRTYAASEGQRFKGDPVLHVVDCPTCFVTYAIPESFYEAALEYNSAAHPRNHWRLCCPFGHEWWYSGLNEEQELRQRLERERSRAGRLAAERDQLEASRNAHKGAATKARKARDKLASRAKSGTCPCCNRTFKQLARHMASQHPDFAPGAEDHSEGQAHERQAEADSAEANQS